MKKIVLENFKCFQTQEIDTKKFNIFFGVNSGGKSSVLQGYLLSMEAFQNIHDEGTIDLTNSKYNMNLYSFEEIYYDESEEESIRIKIYEQDGLSEVEFTSEEGDNNLRFKIGSRKSLSNIEQI